MNQQLNCILKTTLPLACSFSLLVACGPSPTQSGNTPSASPPASTASVTPPSSPEPVSTLAPGAFSPSQFKGFSATDAKAISDSFTQAKFAEFDSDKNNVLNTNELQSYLNQLPFALFGGQGFQVKQTTLTSVEGLLAAYDADKSASLNMTELKNLLTDLLSKKAVFNFAGVSSTDCASSFAGLVNASGVVNGDALQAFFQTKLGLTLNAGASQALNALGILGKTPTQICGNSPSPTPSASSASASPSATPSATTAPTATPSSSVSADASATSDISVVEKTTFNGKVFDDTGAPLDGVTIRAKSLNSAVPFDATTTTSGGSYAFNDAPSGVQIEIGASRSGYTSRRRVEVLKSNKNGDPNANRYDFGTDCTNNFVIGGLGPVCNSSFGVSYNALSDKPEVIAVTPGRNASGIDYKTSFVMKFSEPMDKATVQDNFEVKSFNNKKFTVDTSAAAQTVSGPGDVDNITGTRIWDKAAFNVSWNTAEDEATFTFKEERVLPTDRDSAKTPDYQVALNRQDGAIKDKTGISRGTSEKKFKLTDGDFERSYKFSIKTDEKKPTVDSLVAQTAENSGANSDGDAIKVRFSERMIHYTLGPTIAGGMGGVISQAAGANNALTGDQVAPNYKVTIIRQAVTQMNQTTWANLGGRAIFDTNDPSHKSVILLPLIYTGSTANNVYLNNQFLISAVGSYQTVGNFGPNIVVNNAYFFNLIRPNAAPVAFNFSPAINLADNTAFAADLQSKLNAAANALIPAPSTNPFTVTASAATNGTIMITFNNTNGVYIGFNSTLTPDQANGRVYPIFSIGGQTLTQNGKPDIYKPGDSVNVKVDTTVLDPAGNSVDSSGDNASGNAS